MLAQGKDIISLSDIIGQAHAHSAGVGVIMEKAFRLGGEFLHSQGISAEALAVTDSTAEGKIKFP